MKKYRIDPKSNLYEIVVPTGDAAADDGLFDDCPACQEMERQIQMGNGGEVVIQWEDEDANGAIED